MTRTVWAQTESTDSISQAVQSPSAAVLGTAIEAALATTDTPLVLAVSGGRDSMALLFAMATWAPSRIAAVATFDHGTGVAATQAASLVAAEARRLGLSVIRERARTVARTEAAWRHARWEFLRRVARAFGARVATAHTADDQLETVLLRLLRDTGVRGLASLAAPSAHIRPWLGVTRSQVTAWAEVVPVPFVSDPTNESRAYLRNRVRHDLLPALEAAQPGFGAAMMAIAQKAAVWRRDVDRMTAAWLTSSALPTITNAGGGLNQMEAERPDIDTAAAHFVVHVSVDNLRATTDAGRAVVWPALMAHVSATLDRRGIAELVRFSQSDRIGARLHLAGGATVVRTRRGVQDMFELRGAHASSAAPVSDRHAVDEASGRSSYVWRLVPEPLPTGQEHSEADADSLWRCLLPRKLSCIVRDWLPGDRIRTSGAPAGRRVAKYLSEARIPLLDRSGWPVVVWEAEIVWIPGVCRSVAAPNRPGWSDLIWYRCERERG